MSSLPPPYMINFGISLYFKCQLIKEIHESPYFVVSCDESLNRIVQDEQIDIQICQYLASLSVSNPPVWIENTLLFLLLMHKTRMLNRLCVGHGKSIKSHGKVMEIQFQI